MTATDSRRATNRITDPALMRWLARERQTDFLRNPHRTRASVRSVKRGGLDASGRLAVKGVLVNLSPCRILCMRSSAFDRGFQKISSVFDSFLFASHRGGK